MSKLILEIVVDALASRDHTAERHAKLCRHWSSAAVQPPQKFVNQIVLRVEIHHLDEKAKSSIHRGRWVDPRAGRRRHFAGRAGDAGSGHRILPLLTIRPAMSTARRAIWLANRDSTPTATRPGRRPAGDHSPVTIAALRDGLLLDAPVR